MKFTFEIMKEYEDAFRGISVYSVSEDKKLMVDFVAMEELEDTQKEIDEAYQRGLDDAWEAARKIIHMPEGDLLNIFTECYSAVCTALQVLLKYDAAEAIAKLKAYEEQKADDKIEVGDEVETKDGERFVVTTFGSSLDGDIALGICADGLGLGVDLKELRKTGRHFNIEKILEDMRND